MSVRRRSACLAALHSLTCCGPACTTLQPVSYLSLGMTVGTGAGLLWWYNHEKEKKLEEITREGKSSVVVGQVRGRPWAVA